MKESLNLNPEYSLQVRKIIGTHFKNVREDKGMTQEQLANKMGCSVYTISKIERGVWNFTLDFIVLFCHHLDLYLFLPEKNSDDDLVKLMANRHGVNDQGRKN